MQSSFDFSYVHSQEKNTKKNNFFKIWLWNFKDSAHKDASNLVNMSPFYNYNNHHLTS